MTSRATQEFDFSNRLPKDDGKNPGTRDFSESDLYKVVQGDRATRKAERLGMFFACTCSLAKSPIFDERMVVEEAKMV